MGSASIYTVYVVDHFNKVLDIRLIGIHLSTPVECFVKNNFLAYLAYGLEWC